MEREEALQLLAAIKGSDLVALAAKHGQRIFHEKDVEGQLKRTLNKGWAGLALEAYLGLPPNSRREPNGGSWELKQVSLKRTGEGDLTAKETMQITMLNRAHVVEHPFETSHVLHKIGRFIVVGREYIDRSETTSPIVYVGAADISWHFEPIYRQVEKDYETIRKELAEGKPLHTISGELIQIRTKGQKNSSTYAFYAKTRFVNILLGLNK